MNACQGKQAKLRLWGGKRTRRSQSLVEFALTLPVLLTILAGIVEVANILTINNRVQIVAREGARFGAMGGTNLGVTDVVQQSSTDALAMSADRMKVWVIRPVMLASGSLSWASPVTSSAWNGTAECIFPAGCTDTIPLTPSKVLADVSATGASIAGMNNTRFAITVVQYDADTILNLPWFSPPQTNGRFRMWAYTALRQEVEQTAVAQKTSGCSAYPIALSDVAIGSNAIETTQFAVQINAEPTKRDGFRFLTWYAGTSPAPNFTYTNLTTPTTGTCKGTMWYPGNSYSAACSPLGFVELGSVPADTTLNRPNEDPAQSDWVTYNTASTADVYSLLDTATTGHFATERVLRVIVYNYEATGSQQNPRYSSGVWQYRIDGFADIRLIKTGSTSAASGGVLNFEWVKWDTSCGYQ